MGEMKQGPSTPRTRVPSALQNRKFAFLASFRLSLAQAQMTVPSSEQGWMAPKSAPHIPSWQEYFQLMRTTPGVSHSAAQQMEAFLERCAIGYVKEAGERQAGHFRESFATIAAEARRMLAPTSARLVGPARTGSNHAH